MKKNFFNANVIHSLWVSGMMLCAGTFGLSSCSDKYDDTELRNSVSGLEDRVTALETWQKSVNTSIASLQSVVSALENRNYITGVTAITEGGEEVGYTITFQSGSSITIRNGKDGTNGADGKDGTNGTTPVIGVTKDSSGKYCWTVNGELLKDDSGNAIHVTGNDGATAIAPQVRINSTTNEWEISKDGGSTWTSTGVKATGSAGAAGTTGAKGDSMFSAVTYDTNSVTFTLADGTTKLSVSRVSSALTITANTNSDNTFSLTSALLAEKSGNVVHIRVESPNADGALILTRGNVADTRWEITSNVVNNTMSIVAYPAKNVTVGETALLMVTISDSKGNTLAKGQQVFKNAITVGQAAVVDDVTELKEALSSEDVKYVALAEDVKLTEQLEVTKDKTIELNNQELTSDKQIKVEEGSTLTLKNGTIKQTGGNKISVTTSSDLELDNIMYESTTGYGGILCAENATDDAKITIKNSTIKAGYFGFTTNATTPVGKPIIVLENSTFEAKETALLCNVPATITAKNCTFTSGWQGVFMRGGTAAFEDCKINLVMDETYNDVPEDNCNADGTWKTGNQAVGAALLMGNRCTENASTYNYPTNVTLKNTTFSVTGTAKSSKTTRTAAETPSVYIWSRTENGNGTTFNYDAASASSFNAAGKGLYVGNNGTNLTINGTAYSSGTGAKKH